MTLSIRRISGIFLLTLGVLPAVRAAGPAGCTASVPAPATIRSEGKTELTGDLVLNCSGGIPTLPGAQVPLLSLTIFLNATVSSRTYSNTTASEVLLLVDEPGSSGNPNQLLCASTSGCTITAGSTVGVKYDGFAGHPNIFQGVVNGNSVTFFGVALDAPTAGSSRTLRIVNLRVDATSVAAGAAQITANPSTPSLPINNTPLAVATVAQGLGFSTRNGSDVTRPLDAGGFTMPAGNTGKSNTPAAYLRFSQASSRAFRTRTAAQFAGPDISPPPAIQATPGAAITSESGFTFPVSGGTAGLADSGTRLKGAFNHIPAGVHVWVGLTNRGSNSSALARLIASETGSFVPVPAGDNFGSVQAAEVPLSNGSGVAVWEVLAAGSTSSFDMPVWFIADGAVAGTGTVNATLAPFYLAATSAEPRFADTSVAVILIQVGAAVPPPAAISANPSSLVFRAVPGTSPLMFQNIALTSPSGGFIFNATASVSTGGNWLRVPASGDAAFGCGVFVDATGLAPGFYSGAVRIQMANSSAFVTVPVSLVVQQPPPTGGASQVFSHIADGGNWKTGIILVNTDNVPAVFTLRFWNENGVPWTLSLGPDGFQTQVTGTIPVGGMRTVQTDGFAGNVTVGWAELLTSNAIGGTAVFAEQERGLPDSEAAVIATSLRSKSFFLAFDNSAGSGTGVAIANPDPTQSAQVSVTFRDPSGRRTGNSGPYNVPPRGHVSFVLPAFAGLEGVAEFTSNIDVVGLGIRGHGRAFTSVEPLSRVPAGNKTITHLAEGAGWKTTIILVNPDSQSARFNVRFWGDDGNSLVLSLGPDGRHTELSGTIAAGGSRTIRTDGTASRLVNGWAEVVTTATIGGTAIFAQSAPGLPDSEAAVPIVSGGARRFVVPFDGSSGFGTGLAFGNPAENANVTVIFKSENGSLLGAPATYVIPAHGHFSTVLPVSTRGVAEISSPNTAIFSLGIRGHNGAFTSVRPLLIAPGLADIVTSVGSITAGTSAGALAPLTADWASVASGDANTPAPSSFAAVRSYGLGRVAVIGDEGVLSNSNLLDNAVFAANLMAWLDPAGRRTALWTSGHGELATSPGGALSPALASRDFTSTRLRGTVSAASLAGASVLVIGNARNSFTTEEIQAVTDFVAAGGGLLLAGEGASWLAGHADQTIADYPMNKLAQPFGLVWPASVIVDPDPQDQLSGSTIFRTFYPFARQ